MMKVCEHCQQQIPLAVMHVRHDWKGDVKPGLLVYGYFSRNLLVRNQRIVKTRITSTVFLE